MNFGLNTYLILNFNNTCHRNIFSSPPSLSLHSKSITNCVRITPQYHTNTILISNPNDFLSLKRNGERKRKNESPFSVDWREKLEWKKKRSSGRSEETVMVSGTFGIRHTVKLLSQCYFGYVCWTSRWVGSLRCFHGHFFCLRHGFQFTGIYFHSVAVTIRVTVTLLIIFLILLQTYV